MCCSNAYTRNNNAVECQLGVAYAGYLRGFSIPWDVHRWNTVLAHFANALRLADSIPLDKMYKTHHVISAVSVGLILLHPILLLTGQGDVFEEPFWLQAGEHS